MMIVIVVDITTKNVLSKIVTYQFRPPNHKECDYEKNKLVCKIEILKKYKDSISAF